MTSHRPTRATAKKPQLQYQGPQQEDTQKANQQQQQFRQSEQHQLLQNCHKYNRFVHGRF